MLIQYNAFPIINKLLEPFQMSEIEPLNKDMVDDNKQEEEPTECDQMMIKSTTITVSELRV